MAVRHETSLQDGPTVVRPTYRFIQILRAVAATMVVVHHATIMLWERSHLRVGNTFGASAGVDIFFVISGFVMTISTGPLRDAMHPARTFLARRLERVVPMYWLVTTAKVLGLLLIPALCLNAIGGVRHILASYLFLPTLNFQQAFTPVVVVGWTLDFEMAFYALFAVALAFRWRPMIFLAPVLLLVPLLPFAHYPAPLLGLHFYQDTLLWEFLFGTVLGLAVPWARRVPWPVGIALLAFGFYRLFLRLPLNFHQWRGLWWGLPALAIVLGAISLERRWGARSPRWALELGDASYSIYLVHTFVLPAIGLLLERLGHHWVGEGAVSLVLAVLVSLAAGEALYRLVELPITRWFKGRRRTAVPAVA